MDPLYDFDFLSCCCEAPEGTFDSQDQYTEHSLSSVLEEPFVHTDPVQVPSLATANTSVSTRPSHGGAMTIRGGSDDLTDGTGRVNILHSAPHATGHGVLPITEAPCNVPPTTGAYGCMLPNGAQQADANSCIESTAFPSGTTWPTPGSGSETVHTHTVAGLNGAQLLPAAPAAGTCPLTTAIGSRVNPHPVKAQMQTTTTNTTSQLVRKAKYPRMAACLRPKSIPDNEYTDVAFQLDFIKALRTRFLIPLFRILGILANKPKQDKVEPTLPTDSSTRRMWRYLASHRLARPIYTPQAVNSHLRIVEFPLEVYDCFEAALAELEREPEPEETEEEQPVPAFHFVYGVRKAETTMDDVQLYDNVSQCLSETMWVTFEHNPLNLIDGKIDLFPVQTREPAPASPYDVTLCSLPIPSTFLSGTFGRRAKSTGKGRAGTKQKCTAVPELTLSGPQKRQCHKATCDGTMMGLYNETDLPNLQFPVSFTGNGGFGASE
eukprot:TRINITY_DN67403_c3_g5_i1.p1 TRINITY_DN67403_c3_g5~~TRINITY_DN67403_c3_g5_i1.p1  ORF type:complete len:492 (-),score=45.44 TRINITY_DN67403_c3_g5_i1:704-2179(-)